MSQYHLCCIYDDATEVWKIDESDNILSLVEYYTKSSTIKSVTAYKYTDGDSGAWSWVERKPTIKATTPVHVWKR